MGHEIAGNEGNPILQLLPSYEKRLLMLIFHIEAKQTFLTKEKA